MIREPELVIVLVEPLYDRNIGSVSRVASNLGIKKLILINRQCQITYEAQLAAATGQEALANRAEYAHWDEFLKAEPEGALLAFSARDGRGRQTEELKYITARFTQMSELERLYLVFGREDRGLSSSDLEHCHFCARLPIKGPNFSLNLSHAVMLAGHILNDFFESQMPQEKEPSPITHEMVVTENELSNASTEDLTGDSSNLIQQKEFEQQLLRFLNSLGMNFENRRINAYTMISKLLKRSYPSKKERILLTNILAQATRLIQSRKNNPENK